MDKLPEDWLFVTLNRIEKRMDDHGVKMQVGFDEIKRAQQAHELDDKEWKNRVANLEEKQTHRSMFTQSVHTTLIATGLVASWEAVKHFAGWK